MKIKPPRVHSGFAGSRAELLRCAQPCWGGSWDETSVWSSKDAGWALAGRCLGQREDTRPPLRPGTRRQPLLLLDHLRAQHCWLPHPGPLNLHTGRAARGKGPGKPGVQTLALIW